MKYFNGSKIRRSPTVEVRSTKSGRFAARSKPTPRETIDVCAANERRTSAGKAAFSILEVILALAILTGAMAVLGELGRLGFRNARAAQDISKAQLLCESKMAEYTSGLITTPQSLSNTPFETIDQDSDSTNAAWMYSVELETIDSDGLISVRVTVTQNLPSSQRPTTFSLTRWMLDESSMTTTDSSDTSATDSTSTSSTESGTSTSTGTGTTK
jgi:general secretion pathway protein I